MLRVAACLILLSLSLPAAAQDASDAIVRLNRLENQLRQLSGQIEQLQFENRTLKDQLRKFQEDVEFRFQESRVGARPAAPSSTPNAGAAPATPARPAAPPPQRRSDAFDPGTVPSAPGAPRPLGTTQPSAPLASAGPMPLPGGAIGGIGDLIEDEPMDGAEPLDLSGTARTPVAPPSVPRQGPSVAAVTTADPRAEYDAAYAYLLQKQFEQAEMAFRRFIQSHPRDRLAPDAMYWLGESYLQRNRAREAAEQFLNISTEYPQAAKAPDAMLKLGVSLNALGAQDRACAVFAELDRKYPQAAPTLRQNSDREKKRAKCA